MCSKVRIQAAPPRDGGAMSNYGGDPRSATHILKDRHTVPSYRLLCHNYFIRRIFVVILVAYIIQCSCGDQTQQPPN